MTALPVYFKGAVVASSLVDKGDYDWLSGFRWRLSSGGYAWAWIKGNQVFMHRLILGLGKDDPGRCDHKNRNRLDNRRSNLRIVTHAENTQNQSKRKGSASAYRGVTWDKVNKKWCARGHLDYKKFWLGRYSDELAAAEAVRQFRLANVPGALD